LANCDCSTTAPPHGTTMARSRAQDAKADMFRTSLDHGMRDVCPDNEMIEWCISLHVPGAASERVTSTPLGWLWVEATHIQIRICPFGPKGLASWAAHGD